MWRNTCKLAAIWSLLVGCVSNPIAPKHIDVRAIPEKVPIGTSEVDARTFMEANGFTCTAVSDGSFLAIDVGKDGIQTKKEYEHLRFVDCHRKDGGGFKDGFVTTLTSIALVLDIDSKVTEILMRRELIGL